MLNFKSVCHDYQKTVVNFLIKKKYAGTFLDMGMGKTASVLYAFSWLKKKGYAKRMLIIAPKYVAIHTWADEINKWEEFNSLKINVAVGNENRRLNAFLEDSDIVTINRENVSWMQKNVSMKTFDILVVDELSSFKNAQSQRFLSISKILGQFKFRWGLTGTPCPNTYLDLFSQMFIISPKILGGNFYVYRNKYFYEAYPYNWFPKQDAEKEIIEKIGTNVVSLKAEDYLKMPELIENHIKLILKDKALMKYNKALKDLIYQYEKDKTNQVLDLSKNILIKLQQLASGFIYLEKGKYEIVHSILLDAVGDIVDNEGNTLLFYNFQAEKEIIKDKFPIARELKTTQDFRDWNSGCTKLAIVHPVSVGFGLNLQSGGNNIIWYGLNWDSSVVQQANARLYRQGQKKGVIINYLYLENTIHSRIWDVLNKKITNQDLLLDAVKYIFDFTNKK